MASQPETPARSQKVQGIGTSRSDLKQQWRLWHHLLGEVEGRDLMVGVDWGNMVRETLRRHLVRKVEASGMVRTHGEMLT